MGPEIGQLEETLKRHCEIEHGITWTSGLAIQSTSFALIPSWHCATHELPQHQIDG